MYVGVILSVLPLSGLRDGILHVCGGDPESPEKANNALWYSPCMWG